MFIMLFVFFPAKMGYEISQVVQIFRNFVACENFAAANFHKGSTKFRRGCEIFWVCLDLLPAIEIKHKLAKINKENILKNARKIKIS